MFYSQPEGEKEVTEWLQRETQSWQNRTSPRTESSVSDISYLDSDLLQSSSPSIKDSEWLTLSAQEQLAWVKDTQDPRIARGLRSPLEKKILSLGGKHSIAAKRLLAQKCEEEKEAIRRIQSTFLDCHLSQIDSHYAKRHGERKDKLCTYISREEPEPYEELEKIWKPKKWDYIVNERELKHIVRHIDRAEYARSLRNKTYIKYPKYSPRTSLPRVWSAESKEASDIQKGPKMREQIREWESKQIRGHRERMIRGREVMQGHKERLLYRIPSQIPRILKPEVKKKQITCYELINAYPLLQPRHGKRLEVNVLIDKSMLNGEDKEEKEEKEEKIRKKLLPTCPVFLKIPPFLRSKVNKMNTY